jgi:outer membrane protein TolC
MKTFLIFCATVLLGTNMAFAQNGRPLTLKECIELALRNNSSVRNAERQAQIAGTNVMTARASVLPVINSTFSSGQFKQGSSVNKRNVPVGVDSTTGQVIYQQREILDPSFTQNSHAMSITARMNVFDFGRSWNRIRQANASEDASTFSYESSRQTTIRDVQQRYLAHLKALRLLEVQQEAVKSNEEQLKRIESMYEIGSVAQGDVFRQRTVLGISRIAFIQQENAVAETRAALNVVLAREANAELAILDIEDIGEIQDYKLEEALKIAVEKSPELKSSTKNIRSAELGVAIAKTSYLPSLGISVNYSRDNAFFDKVYSNFSQNYSVNLGASLSFNLFNGFSDHAEVQRQHLNYEIAQENYRDLWRTKQWELERALLAMKAWKEITEINQENLKSAEEDLRLAQERYRVGAGTLLEIINAQYAVTNAKATLVSAKYETMIARGNLQAAMGTLEK